MPFYMDYAAAAKSLQSCPTLCDPIDSSPPGSSVPGILQTRTLEWIAISFSTWTMSGSQKAHQYIQDYNDNPNTGWDSHQFLWKTVWSIPDIYPIQPWDTQESMDD